MTFIPTQQNSSNATEATDATTAPTTLAPTQAPTAPPYGPYTVTYRVEYADADCFMKEEMTIMEGSGMRFIFDYDVPDEMSTELTLQDDITAGVSYTVQDVMEVAVDNFTEHLYFSVLYTGNATGYFVKGIGGVRSNPDCMWFLYYRGPNMEYPFLRSYGVSEFIAEPNSTVVMRYQYPPIHAVYFEVDFPHVANCSVENPIYLEPLTISLYFGAPNYTYTVQRVMELAVDMEPSYQFLVTYYGRRRGYEVQAINGTENHDDCSWHFFYIPPRTARESASNYSNISYFTVEANSTILMSYQIIERPPPPTTQPPPPEPSTDPLPSSSSSSSPTPAPTSADTPFPSTEDPTTQTTEPTQASPTPAIPTMKTGRGAGVPLRMDSVALILALFACLVYSM